jgi:hypothetical protein
MADANPKIMEMIEAELKKNPDISNKELFDRATQIDKGIAKLSPRQFNAMYPLQVKRALKPRKRGARKSKAAGRKSTKGTKSMNRGGARAGAAGGDSRARVRSVLLDLAKDIANAQGKGDVVDVVAGIDRYVDRAIKAAS